MNDTRVEGTLRLDGLIEGRLPTEDDAERLREWISFAETLGLRFSLEVQGASFNLLADDGALQSERLGPEPAETIRDALEQLARALAGGEAELFSTLRSREYVSGTEVQAVYGFTAAGGVECRVREVDTETTTPPPLRTRRDVLRLAGLGVLVALALFGISALFVDYRALFDRLGEAALPLDPEEVALDAGAFADYFTLEKMDSTRMKGGRRLTLTLERKRYPKGPVQLDEEYRRVGKDPLRRLALDALAKGYARCEIYGKGGEFLHAAEIRIAGLRREETVRVVVDLPSNTRPARIVVGY